MYIFHKQLASGSSTISTIYRAAAWRTKRAARWTGRALHLFIVLMMTLLPVAPLGAMPAYAASGDFSIDFVAAAPESYNHLIGGGAYDDRTVGVDKDVVESLEGGDFACGDIATFFAAVTVDNTQSAIDDGPQTIEMDFSFLMDTTGQSGVAIGDIVLVQVNYGTIEDLIVGENSEDDGISDNGGSVATLINEWTTGPIYTAGSELWGTVELTDLEAGEQVVVRIDAKLYCDPGSDPTGNLQAAMMDARLSFINDTIPVEPQEAISSGAQTIPWKQIGNIATPAIDVQKTVTTAYGTCGIDDAELLTITSGDTVKYCYVVINDGDVGANLFNVTLSDDNGTPEYPTDDFSVSLTGLTDVDEDGNADDLFNGDIVTGEALVTINGMAVGDPDKTIVNTATAAGDDSIILPTTLIDTDIATVIVQAPLPVAPQPRVIKGNEEGNDTVATLVEPGGLVAINVVVTNDALPLTGDAVLTSLVDDIYFDITTTGHDGITATDCETGGVIAGGGSYSCSFTVDIASSPRTITDTVTATLSNGAGTVTDDDQANVVITDLLPNFTVQKLVDADGDAVFNDITEEAAQGAIVTYKVIITNNSSEALVISSISDDIYSLVGSTCETLTSIPGNSSVECTFTGTAPNDDNQSITDTITVVGSDNDGNSETQTDDANITTPDVFPDITVSKTANPTALYEPGGVVEFTIVVTNNSLEDVTIDSLSDSDFDLAVNCPDAVDTVLGYQGTYTCVFTEVISGDFSGPSHENTVIVEASDDDGNSDTATDNATVDFLDLEPTIQVTKTANPSSVPETGGFVTFTFLVENIGEEDVTLTSLTDTVFGDLNGQGDCVTGGLIPIDGNYSCSITAFLASDSLTAHYNVATAVGTDDDGTTAEDTDNETVIFEDVLPDITIDKTASPSSVPETGGEVTFTFVVTNHNAEEVILDSLVDDTFGDLNGKGTCVTGGTIAGNGGTYSCAIIETLTGDDLLDHVNEVTATAYDDDGTSDTATDDETVTFTDVAPDITVLKTAYYDSVTPAVVPETGGYVTFTFRVDNIGVEDVTLTSLDDDVFGDLFDTNLNPTSTCASVNIPVGGDTYSCSITKFLASDSLAAHYNVATGVGTDNDGTTADDFDEEMVTFTDVPPVIDVTKTAYYDSVTPAVVPETGGDVTFTFDVENTGTEGVWLTSLTDTVFLNLNGQGDCVADGTEWISVGETYSCSITVFLDSDSLAAHYNVATGVGTDNDGTTADDFDEEMVTFTDVPPVIDVTKTAYYDSVTPAVVPETGGDVTFTFDVENTGTEGVWLTSLTDTVFLNLNGQGDCVADGTEWISVGETYSCSITVFLDSDSLAAHYNVATGVGTDNDGTTADDFDEEMVTFTDVPPVIDVTKTAYYDSVTPAVVPETGGDVTFTFDVENTGTEGVWLTSLTDTVFLNLNGQGDCVADGTEWISVGETYSCSITVFLDSDSLAAHYNVATGVGTDNDGTTADDFDEEMVTFTDVPPVIDVTKTAYYDSVTPAVVPETGGDVTFTFDVENTGTEGVWLTSLTDTVFLNLNGQGDCVADGTEWISVGETYSCSITVFLDSDSLAAHYNVATGVGTDNDGTTADDFDEEMVTFTDVPPVIDVTKTAYYDSVTPAVVPETGGDVTFTFDVENTGTEGVWLTSLTDTVFLNLNGQGDCVADGTEWISVGETYSCSITVFLDSDSLAAHYNVATGVGTDNDGTTADDFDEEMVTFTDVPPVIDVTKTAYYDSVTPAVVPETGGDVTFTFDVENTGTEGVWLTSLTDTVFLNLNGQGDCVADGTEWISVGETYSCSITVFLDSDSLAAHYNVATGVGTDNDGTTADDFDEEMVTFTDVPPVIDVTKTAYYDSVTPAVVPETGGDVTFTFDVENTGTEGVWLTSLTDTVFLNLNGQGDCVADGTEWISVGETYSCSITVFLDSDSLAAHYNVATGVGTDNDGTTADDFDEEMVTFTDVPPVIDVTKTAYYDSVTPAVVPETGGDVTFTFDVENTGTEGVWLTSLTDTVFLNLNGQGDCVADGTEWISVGETYSCSITVFLDSDSLAAHYNVATGVGTDNDGTTADDFDEEMVTFTDVPPVIDVTKTAYYDSVTPAVVPETGGDVTFTFDVENTGTEGVWLTSLTDTVFLNLNGQGDCVADGTEWISVGETYSCSITVFLDSDSLAAHYNVATGVGTDNDGTTADDFDEEMVTFTDVPPVIDVTKTAYYDSVTPAVVPETGGDVTFTFDVENTGTEGVWLTSLTDTVFLNLNGQGDCVADGTEWISVGETYSCSITVFLDSDSLAAHYNVATGVGTDNDGTTADDFDEEMVTFTDVLPDISVSKIASPENVPSTGAVVTFTITVTNHNGESVTLDSLTDDIYGDLTILVEEDYKEQKSTTCANGETITGNGGTYACKFTALVPGEAGINFGTETDTVTAVASDNDGNSDDASDSATVTITPPIYVTDSALCTFDVDPETDGRQFLNLLSMDPQNLPYYKVTATNPGQYYYNMSVSGKAGTEVTITLRIPWPFVTQGARPVHVYDSVSLDIDPVTGQTCYTPNYEGETEAIDNYIQLSDYYDQVVDFDPGDSGYTEGAYVEVSLTIEIPSTGFAYINQHMDYGLKDRDANPDGYAMDSHQIDEETILEDAIRPDTQIYLEPVVLIPDLAVHEFCTYLGSVATGDLLGCDSVQVDNEFKTNPGIAGLVLEIVLDTDGFTDEMPLSDVLIQLKYEDGKVAGEDLSDEHGWYQIVYKHLGRPTNYIFEAYLSGSVEVSPDFTRVVELKGNEFQEVMMYLDPDGLASAHVHVGSMVADIKPGPKTWNMTVEVKVVDDGGAPVANAQVSGVWSYVVDGKLVTELGFCVTDSEGLCEVALAKILNGETVTFTINDITAADYFYDSGANVVSAVDATSG